MKDFFRILNHLLQAYIVMCTFLLLKEKIDSLQVTRFVLRQIFCCPGLPGWPSKRDTWKIFSPVSPEFRHRDTGISANRAGPVVM